MHQYPRNKQLQWCLGFCLTNSLLFWLLGLLYTPFFFLQQLTPATAILEPSAQHFIYAFVALSYFGFLSLCGFAPCLISIPWIVLFPRLKGMKTAVVITASLGTFLLILDTIAFSQYQFHLSLSMLRFLLSALLDHVFNLSWVEYSLAFAVFSFIVFIQATLAWIWQRYLSRKEKRPRLILWGSMAPLFCLYSSTYMLLLAASNYALITCVMLYAVEFLPLHSKIHQSLIKYYENTVGGVGRVALLKDKKGFIKPLLPAPNLPLNYPDISRLMSRTTAQEKPLNLLMIVIDTWRFDMLTDKNMPFVHQFAARSTVFSHHLSGGNATEPGIFSLFYSLPVTYWGSMAQQHRAPLFMEALQKNNYQIKIFSSASLNEPDFAHTVFQGVKTPLTKASGNTPYQRDQSISQAFIQFINEKRPKQPFFSFLFYDAAHTYCGFDEDLVPNQPVVKRCQRMLWTDPASSYFNRYKNALLLVDQEIQQVITQLEKNHLLNNTIVLITGDHGEEFDDNHLGFRGHASNFTPYQVQTPLLIYQPGQPARTIAYRTSHYDIVPTLMNTLWHYSASSSRYAVGSNLFDNTPRPYIIVGSYNNLGIIEKHRTVTIYPEGRFQVHAMNGQPLFGETLNSDIMKHVFSDIRRFYGQY